MPNSAISEESFFFTRIETLCKGPAVTCEHDMDVVEVARLMQDHDVTAVVVVEGTTPQGVFSMRDLRKFVADSGDSLAGRKVRDNMGHGLVTIQRRDYVFEAVFKLARYNIFRLGVVDEEDKLIGIITATDLLKMQTFTPVFLHQEIEAAHSIDQLRMLGVKMLEMVRITSRAGIDTRSIVRLVSRFNDTITLRLITLLESCEGIRLPAGAAFLALGSEGRGEQTLRTDQDSAIVYRDDLPPERLRDIERFADRLVDALEEIGVPRCPGKIMASSPRWRHSLSDWKQLVDLWVSSPTPEYVLNFGMFQDLRPLHGEETLGAELRDHILTTVHHNASFFPNMASHVVRFPSPFNLFGRVRVELGGEHRGKIDLKKAGIFAITTGTSLLALEAGIIGGNTWEKLERLHKRGIFSSGDFETIQKAFSFLTQLRLQRQLQELPAHGTSTYHIDPQTMTNKERDQLRQALNGVNTFLWIFRDQYNLNFMSY
jgi:CBS domain-containing protein